MEAHKITYLADYAQIVMLLECYNQIVVDLYIGIDYSCFAIEFDVMSFVVPTNVALRAFEPYVLHL